MSEATASTPKSDLLQKSVAISWIEFNRQYLNGALAEVRTALERYAQRESDCAPDAQDAETQPGPPPGADPPAIEMLARTFNLTGFERAIVLLCAGMELNATFAELCAAAQGEARPYPTFTLALGALADPHWSALTPAGPLRRWNLIETQQAALTSGRLRIDERILHFLAGVQQLDERVASLVDPMEATQELVPSQAEVVRGMVSVWSRGGSPAPVIQLSGGDEASRRAIAAAAAHTVGLAPFALAAEDLPSAASEFDAFLKLWQREAALMAAVLYVDTEALEKTDQKTERRVCRLLEQSMGPMVVSVRDRLRPLRRPVKTIEVRKPSAEEQRELWESLLEGAEPPKNGRASELAAQFNLSSSAIRTSVQDCFFIGDMGSITVDGTPTGATDVPLARRDDATPTVSTIASARAFATTGVGGALLDRSAGDYGAIYFPGVHAPDPIGAGRNPKILLPPSPFMAGICARIDNSRGVFKAPAGTEAGVAGALGPYVLTSDTEQDQLNPVMVNVLRTVPGSGLVVWGARTFASDASWRYIPVRRIATFLRVSIYNGIQWAVFEPNDEPLWSSLRLNIRSFMLTQYRAGAFQGSTPDTAFFVKCDKSTTTQQDIDNGVVNILVGFAPLKPAEFVVLKLSQIVNHPAS